MPGEMLLRVRALVCKWGLGTLERKLNHVFGKHVFLRLFLCFGLVRLAQIIQRERISQIKCTFAAEALLVCSSLLPLPCGPIPGAAPLLPFLGPGCRKGTLL